MSGEKALEVICWWAEAFNGGCPYEGTSECFENCDQFIRAVEVDVGGEQ